MAFLNWPFTATKVQVATYLLGVALFSISFLVFLNASASFVITDLIGQKRGVGNAVGSLGFADELVALIACPIWGLLSDKIGVRNVCVLGYLIVGVSLFVFVQANNVNPQLLLARIFFSVGGAATSTMVTAVLPTMTLQSAAALAKLETPVNRSSLSHGNNGSSLPRGPETAGTFAQPYDKVYRRTSPQKSATSQVAGLVGMFTGVGALIALGLFLPLPARFSKLGYGRAQAVTASFYIVGAIALIVGSICFLGLRNLPGEGPKGWRFLTSPKQPHQHGSDGTIKPASSLNLLRQSLVLGFTDLSIGIGYLGGFVARASSVGISSFIPLFVNAYFIRSGLCPTDGGLRTDPSDVKERCRQAYTLAAALSGVSQAVALICAPVFGYLDGKFGRRFNGPLIFAAGAGVLGYVVLAQVAEPDAGGLIWLCMALLGISQIGAIVCSLSSLSRGIEAELDEIDTIGHEDHDEEQQLLSENPDDRSGTNNDHAHEDSPLISSQLQGSKNSRTAPRSQLKGTIAGLYSLAGGAGILLLTKLGGYLFDKTSPGAPFYMLAIFNAILLIVISICTTAQALKKGGTVS